MGLKDLNFKGIKVESSAFMPSSRSSELGKKVGTIDFKVPPAKIDADNLKKDDIKKLLTKYGQDSGSKAVKDIESFEFDNKNRNLTINYKTDKSKKIINEDLSFQTIKHNINSKTGGQEVIHCFYDSNNILLKEKRSNSQNTHETYFDKDRNIYLTVEFDKLKNSTTTVEFGENQTPQYKTVACGATVTRFDFQGENNSERILEKTENKGLPVECRETYTYRSDGNIEIRRYSASMESEPASQSNMNKSNSTDTHSMSTNSTEKTNNKESNNKSNINATSETVVYCSSSNFDTKTGTIKNPDQVSSTPPETQSNKETENNPDCTSKSEQAEKPENESASNTVVSNSVNNTDSSKIVKNTSEAAIEQSVHQNQLPRAAENQVKNEYKTQISDSKSTVLPQQMNSNTNSSVQINSTAYDSKIVPNTISQSSLQAGAAESLSSHNLATQSSSRETSGYKADISVIKTQVENVYNKFNSFIREYAAKNNLSEDKVKELLTLNPTISTNEFYNKVLKITDTGLNDKISKLLADLDNMLSQSSGKIADIQVTLSELSTLINQQHIHIKRNNNFDLEMAGEPKVVSDITQFSNDNGFKASELYEATAGLKYGEFRIIDISKTMPTGQVTETFKIEKTNKGKILLTQVKKETNEDKILIKQIKKETNADKNLITQVRNEANNVDIQQVRQISNALIPFLPATVKNELKMCKTVLECKKVIEKYFNSAQYTLSESVKPDVKNSDLQYRYIVKDGVYQKVSVNTPLSSKFTPVEELRLNVYADRAFFDEISDLMSNGVYKSKSGKIVKVKIPNMMLSTAASPTKWTEQAEPVVLSFSEPVTPEIETAFREIAHKYHRTKESSVITTNKSYTKATHNVVNEDEKRYEHLIEILNGLGIPNVQTAAFIASMVYVSSDGLRKTFVNKNSNETELSSVQTVNMKDSVY